MVSKKKLERKIKQRALAIVVLVCSTRRGLWMDVGMYRCRWRRVLPGADVYPLGALAALYEFA